MTSTELAVVVGGVLLGYWIVSSVLGGKVGKSQDAANTARTSNATPNSGQPRPKADEHELHQYFSNSEINIATDWFRILDIAETAEQEAISAAYKQKISQYHPDKITKLGSELRYFAEYKSKQINAAYDYAMRLRG